MAGLPGGSRGLGLIPSRQPLHRRGGQRPEPSCSGHGDGDTATGAGRGGPWWDGPAPVASRPSEQGSFSFFFISFLFPLLCLCFLFI